MNYDFFVSKDIFSGLYILLIVAFFIFLSEILFNYFNVKSFITRKFVHFSTGVLLIFSPYIFHAKLIPIILSN